MEILTIGFTKKSAERFFGLLEQAGVRRLVDVRLRNSSQLAGWAKRGDLEFFLREILGAEYIHEPALAPTDELLTAYRKRALAWDEYERRFLELMSERAVEDRIPRSVFEPRAVLLCTEHLPDRCHRRLVAEYLAWRWGEVTIRHLF